MNLSRSEFLKLMAGVAGTAFIPQARANPWGLPLGIQLYTVRNDLKANFPGTLAKLVAMGYKEVEAGFTDEGTIDFNGGAPLKFKKMLDDAGARDYPVLISLCLTTMTSGLRRASSERTSSSLNICCVPGPGRNRLPRSLEAGVVIFQ